MKKIISLAFDVYFKGEGIVNRNGSDKVGGIDVLFAKKRNGKPYVSRDCILHEVLEEPFGFKYLSQSGNYLERLMVNMSKYRMLRGNMDATEGTHRKSPLMFGHAFATDKCDEIFIDKRSKGNMGGVFHVEEVQNTHHKSRVVINLNELQFISTFCAFTDVLPVLNSDVFCLDNKGVDKIKEIWSDNFPDTEFPKVKNYLRNRLGQNENEIFHTEGVKLSDKDTFGLVNFFIERLKAFHLTKAHSFLEFDSLDNIRIYTDNGKESISQEEMMMIFSGDVAKVHSLYTETEHQYDWESIRQKIDENKSKNKKQRF